VPFRCKDGVNIVVAVGTEAHYSAFCEAVNLSQFCRQQQSNSARVVQREALQEEMEKSFSQLDSQIALQRLQEKRVPAGVVRDMAQVFDDPLALPMVLKAQTSQGEVGASRTVSFRINGHLSSIEEMDPPPRCGQDLHEVMQTMGISPNEVASLIDTAVLFDEDQLRE